MRLDSKNTLRIELNGVKERNAAAVIDLPCPETRETAVKKKQNSICDFFFFPEISKGSSLPIWIFTKHIIYRGLFDILIWN